MTRLSKFLHLQTQYAWTNQMMLCASTTSNSTQSMTKRVSQLTRTASSESLQSRLPSTPKRVHPSFTSSRKLRSLTEQLWVFLSHDSTQRSIPFKLAITTLKLTFKAVTTISTGTVLHSTINLAPGDGRPTSLRHLLAGRSCSTTSSSGRSLMRDIQLLD